MSSRSYATPRGEKSATQAGTTSTSYTYTGQYSDSYINLLDYGSRRYDPELGRFIQPDSIVPDPSNSQAYDRYAYTFNNPVRYNDPTGHWPAWASYAVGAFTQVLDDNTLGVFYAALGDPKDVADPAFQEGRNLGRAISTTQAMVEVTIGVIMIEAAAASIPPTAGGGLACAAVSGGTCAVPAGLVITGEVAVGLEGILLAGHGGAMMAKIGSGDGGRPGSNSDQNKQFNGAVREIERQIGRPLDQDEIQQLHHAIHDLEDPGFWDIVEQGLKEFEKGE